MYLVSVLVPVYRVENYIERCARSLFEQTYHHLEYIFVDDCSPDRSMQILEDVINDYPERKSQVKIIRHSVNRGIAAVRNTALDAAKGTFVCHVDSDDYMETDAISLMVERQLIDDSDIVTVCACQHLREGVQLIRQVDVDSKEKLLLSILQPNSEHTIWGRLIRVSLYKDHGVMNIEGCDQGEDWWTVPKLFYYASSFSCIERPLYHYDFTRNDSMCALNAKKGNVASWKNDILSIENVADFFSDKEEQYRRASSVMAISILFEYLCMAAYSGEKSFFNDLKHLIAAKYMESFSVIGWNRILKKNLMGCYIFNRLYQRHTWLRHFYASFFKLVEK